MCFSKRFLPVFLGFWGLLISVGYRSVFTMVMVHIVKSENYPNQEEPSFLGFYCFVNESFDLSTDWTPSSIQYLHSGYYAGLFSTQILGGYLSTRYSSKMICGITILISSVLLFFIPTAIEVNFILVLVVRMVQGAIEGCSQSAINGVISAWTPMSEKSRMITILYSGAYISPAVALAVTGITACTFSWNASLYIYAACGVLWSCIWLLFVLDTPSQHSGLSRNDRLLFEREGFGILQSSDEIADKIPWRKICSSLPVWAVFVGSFCRNWMFSLTILGIPQYFRAAFTTNIAKIGLQSALPSIMMTMVTIIGGAFFDKLIKSQLVSTTIGRKIAQCVGFGVEACCIFGLRFTNKLEIALVVLCVGVAISGLSVSGYEVNPLDLSPQYFSMVTGLVRFGTLGGIINTVVSGKLVPENIEAWQNIFTISGSIHLAGVIFYGLFASGERQNWVIENHESTPLINHVEQDQIETTLNTESEETKMKY